MDSADQTVPDAGVELAAAARAPPGPDGDDGDGGNGRGGIQIDAGDKTPA
jgi:hypothetical protein